MTSFILQKSDSFSFEKFGRNFPYILLFGQPMKQDIIGTFDGETIASDYTIATITGSGLMENYEFRELLINGGFESGSFLGWSFLTSGSFSGSSYTLSSWAFSGSRALLLNTKYPRTIGVNYICAKQDINPPYRVMDLPSAKSLRVALFNSGSALNGYFDFEIVVESAEGRRLHYYWDLDGNGMPGNTAADKYINMGRYLRPFEWEFFERDLKADWIGASLPSSDRIASIRIVNYGKVVYIPPPPSPYYEYSASTA